MLSGVLLCTDTKGALTLGPGVPYHAKHECPPSPLPHWPALTLLQSNSAWARLSYLIYRAQPVFLPAFFSSVSNIFNCSLGSAICKTFADFSTAFYEDIVCCCLPEFKVNPSQTVTMMLALCACAGGRASVLYWSPPLPTVPGPPKRDMLE